MRQFCSEVLVNLQSVDDILCLELLWRKANSWLPEFNHISISGTDRWKLI